MKWLSIVLLAGVIVVGLVGISQSAFVINEVCYDPVGSDTGAEWIELKNTGTSSETVTGYDLNAVSGDYYTFSALAVPAGDFVVVYWRKDGSDDTDFSDNVAHLYTGTSGFDANMGDTRGWVALFNSTTHSSSTIIDYVAYGAGSHTWESDAVTAGIWSAGDYAPDVDAGHSLEYDGSGNTGSDWFDQSTPTPGVDNTLPVTLSAFTVSLDDGVATLRWTTESEIDNLGFHIWRASGEDGPYVRITGSLIQGFGTSATRHTYTFKDFDLLGGMTYWYKLEDIAFDGATELHGPISVVRKNLSTVRNAQELPTHTLLAQNQPNPFNPATTISYSLAEPTQVSVIVYDLTGQVIQTLLSEFQPAGYYTVPWTVSNQASGVYFYQLKAGRFIQTKRMVLLR